MEQPERLDDGGTVANGTRRLAELLSLKGPWTTVYVDGDGDEPQSTEEAKRDAVVQRLDAVGAPPQDSEVIARALAMPAGVPAPSARYLLVQGGKLRYDERFAEPRRGRDVVAAGPVPELLPLLRHHTYAPRYLVVETSRDGADLRLERAGRAHPEQRSSVDGITDELPKVQAGGLAQARWQRHSEEVWKHNQSDVADAINKILQKHEVDFVVVAGDVRARQLLKERLAGQGVSAIVEVEMHTRAAGADSGALDRAISEALEAGEERELDEVLTAAHASDGERKAEGIDDAVTALQQAQVEVLVLDARWIDEMPKSSEAEAEPRLSALDAEPWVSSGTSFSGGARELARIPAAEALARAAILTGARVHVTEEAFAEPDTPRERSMPRPPIALLRWSNEQA